MQQLRALRLPAGPVDIQGRLGDSNSHFRGSDIDGSSPDLLLSRNDIFAELLSSTVHVPEARPQVAMSRIFGPGSEEVTKLAC